MNYVEVCNNLIEDVKSIISSEFSEVITETDSIPSIDDAGITYPNLVTKEQKSKIIETCVLYIDIRKSTQLNLNHRRDTLAKLYSSFARVMAQCGHCFDGKVRNIIGDRLMVLFNRNDCFTNAVNTAILMNSTSKYILNKYFPHDNIRCGIGIDYGKMLITKVGIIKRGSENTSNKSLVWLGPPANIASKLADNANKTISMPGINEGFYYPLLNNMVWLNTEVNSFVNKLSYTFSPYIKHENNYFSSFLKTDITYSYEPILVTEQVYAGYKKNNPYAPAIINNWWKIQNNISDYAGRVYGADIIFKDIQK
jgi:class 3 adenylate cyclase